MVVLLTVIAKVLVKISARSLLPSVRHCIIFVSSSRIVPYMVNFTFTEPCIVISNNILKHCVIEISKPMNFIFNYSLMTGVFPDRFKYAIILPIHKKGDKFIMSNFMPISLLLSCSKILETIMFNRLYQYMHTNEILAPKQFGFRKASNIEKAVFSLTDNVLSSLNL